MVAGRLSALMQSVRDAGDVWKRRCSFTIEWPEKVMAIRSENPNANFVIYFTMDIDINHKSATVATATFSIKEQQKIQPVVADNEGVSLVRN